jgi:predicted naringenin-chalcone synthase
MNSYEKALRLEPGKLAASRRVLSEYGNMIGRPDRDLRP